MTLDYPDRHAENRRFVMPVGAVPGLARRSAPGVRPVLSGRLTALVTVATLAATALRTDPRGGHRARGLVAAVLVAVA